MSKKFLPVLLVLTVGSLFVAFQTQGRGGDNPKTKNEKILRNVGLLLEQGHYSPKNINDSFSKQVLNRFIKELDEDKSIFLQSDIDSFKKYDNRIDDEIHGDKLESFYAINDSYTRRLNQASQYFTELLSKPLDFTKEEQVLLDGNKLSYPTTDV
ncbi:MAG: tail-specific protease, partial [Ferruginibacter sp.]|nr:tail-specific protease [Ferruginibacter sp.]